MPPHLILAHDLGTTGDKATLWDADGSVRGGAFHPYQTTIDRVGWAEQNPDDWWRAVCTTTQQLVSTAHVHAHDIACISFSGQMMGCVAVDRQARPLHNAIIWADNRAVEEAEQFAAIGAAAVYRLTGHRIGPSYSGAKMLWLRRHKPDVFAATHKFLQAKDFIVARLTGQFATDLSDACGTLLYDLERRDWSPRILDAIKLDRALLPELHASTDVVGELTAQAAAAAGLAAGTPVVIGGGDGVCAATGAGVISEGGAYTYIGSSAWIGIATRQPIFDPAMRTFTFAHAAPGLFTPTGAMQAAGAAYQWLRDTLCQPEKDAAAAQHTSPYALMDALAEQSPPGANGLLCLPYLMGERSPRWNPQARAAYVGLTIKHTRADMVRAVLEGVAFNLRGVLDAFEEQGARPPVMRVIGGGARGRIWRQIMADVYNRPVQRLAMVEEATSMGAAIAGGLGVGLFKDMSIAACMTPVTDVLEPQPAAVAVYARQYAAFNRAYTALSPVYADLASL